jgi:hypothetical protein
MARLRKSISGKLSNNQSLKPTNLVGQTQAVAHPTAKLNAVNDLTKLPNGNLPLLKGIQFGLPSNTGVKLSSSAGTGNEWTSLIKTASGGAADLIVGGFLESGVNSLISGLTSLFGGGKNEAPLVRFTLPNSQQQTMYVNSGGLSASASFQTNVAQAVKNALLTSSSLNDVISEI